jgi:hypothetical protein
MKIVSIINDYYTAFAQKYGNKILPSHIKALNAMRRCRTPESGQLYIACPDCNHAEWRPVSCGHRSCPQCQNHEASQWIDRQTGKLLPAHYFMITFTLPYELRKLVWDNQRSLFSIFFDCVSSTLKDFGQNPRNLGADIGMTMVLHTHSRRLDFHPHIHVIVPGGGINKSRKQWIKKKERFLFSHKALAKVFRARFINALNLANMPIPKGIPSKWVVDCTGVGKGISALKYLSRYLYRGVIGESNIVSNKDGQVTFRYTEGKTGETRYLTLKGEDFLFLIVQHVLPKGFRRARDYGFLHGNAKQTLLLVQMILHVIIKKAEIRKRPPFLCPYCKTPMVIIGFQLTKLNSG